MVYNIVEGTTDSLQFQLLDNGAPIDLSQFTTFLLLEDREGTALDADWVLSVYDPTNGRFLFTPSSEDLLVASRGPYYARWKLVNVVDASVSYVPSGVRDVWNISGI